MAPHLNKGHGITLWRILREVSTRTIRRNAEKKFTLALVGHKEELTPFIEFLLQNKEDPWPAAYGSERFMILDPDSGEKELSRAKKADAVLVLSQYKDLLDKISTPNVAVHPENYSTVIGPVLDSCMDLAIPISRRLPVFRDEASRRLTNETSHANAKIAVASALPGIVPLGNLLLPVGSAADVVILTKNQILLMLKIAAIYGKPVNLKDRFAELLPVVGGAFGWRALARELVGAVPAGIGVAVKGAIAYTGTMAVGKGACMYYQSNAETPEEFKQYYKQATLSEQSILKKLVGKWSKKKNPQEP